LQKETVIVRRYSTVPLLPHKALPTKALFSGKFKNFVKSFKSFCFEEHYFNIVQGFCKASYHVPASSDPSPY
jgi:hypothetical protein